MRRSNARVNAPGAPSTQSAPGPVLSISSSASPESLRKSSPGWARRTRVTRRERSMDIMSRWFVVFTWGFAEASRTALHHVRSGVVSPWFQSGINPDSNTATRASPSSFGSTGYRGALAFTSVSRSGMTGPTEWRQYEPRERSRSLRTCRSRTIRRDVMTCCFWRRCSPSGSSCRRRRHPIGVPTLILPVNRRSRTAQPRWSPLCR